MKHIFSLLVSSLCKLHLCFIVLPLYYVISISYFSYSHCSFKLPHAIGRCVLFSCSKTFGFYLIFFRNLRRTNHLPSTGWTRGIFCDEVSGKAPLVLRISRSKGGRGLSRLFEDSWPSVRRRHWLFSLRHSSINFCRWYMCVLEPEEGREAEDMPCDLWKMEKQREKIGKVWEEAAASILLSLTRT